MSFLRRRWEKNWPEIRSAFRGELPEFVLAARPAPLGDCVPVFWYHTVEPERFEADLRFLAENGYTTLQADALEDHLLGHRAAPDRSVVLSFDDGPFNLYAVAFPLLRTHGQRGVAFVAPRFHDQGEQPEPDAERPCSWDEIREMHRSGVLDFQSHTLEHRYVPRWPEPLPLTGIAARYQRRGEAPLSVEEDFRQAKTALESRLEKPVRHLAFPGFEGSPAAIRAGQASGYQCFWWGLRPGRRGNQAGNDTTEIVRLSGEFLRRLPGRGRSSLASLLGRRYGAVVRQWLR